MVLNREIKKVANEKVDSSVLQEWASCLLDAVDDGSQACSFSGYKFNGSSLNYSIYKTISFSDFPIRAALVYPPLQQLFENKMKDMVSQNTRLRIVDTQ